MEIPVLDKFRLVGGTGLALQYGHRKSFDVDLFSEREFDNDTILQALEAYLYPEKPLDIRSYPFGFFCSLYNIKTDFMCWGHSFIYPPLIIEGIRMAAPEEILAMKLHATSSRRNRKEFFDIALLPQYFDLKKGIHIFKQKHPEYDSGAIIKQLVYFDEAEKTNDPAMLIPLVWNEVKEKITTAVKKHWEEGLK
jgi:hypothetical protein